jgi:hypothetical protein
LPFKCDLQRYITVGGGEGSEGGDGGEVLGLPLPPLRAVLHRFRTFDIDHSPCRH